MSEMEISKMQEQRIRELAYHIWEKDGRPAGRDLEHWLKAEQSLATVGGMPSPAFVKTPGFGSADAGPADPANMSLRLKPPARRSSTPRKAPEKKKKTAR